MLSSRLERWSGIVRVLDPEAMGWEAVVARFRDCAAFSGVCPSAAADAILGATASLRDANDLINFIGACTRL